jgi:hypothetical protein
LFNMIYMLMVKERLGNHQDEVETWEWNMASIQPNKAWLFKTIYDK